MNKDWESSLAQLKRMIKDGLGFIKAGSVTEIITLRYELGMWRVYIADRYAQFDAEYSLRALEYKQSEDKISIAQAELFADSLAVAINRRIAKELLETLNQLANACASAISFLTNESRNIP